MDLIALGAAIILMVGGHLLAGRLAGLFVTALCSAMMAYFLMPPVLSFRVSQTSDLFTIVLFNLVGIVVARSAASKSKYAVIRAEPLVADDMRPARPQANGAHAIAELMSGDFGVRLGTAGITLDTGDFILPCMHGEAISILLGVLTEALQSPEVRHISLCAGRRPGVLRLFIAAHRVWPPPLNEVIVIGKRDADCASIGLPMEPLKGWACWFDNGYGRIFQIVIEDTPAKEHYYLP